MGKFYESQFTYNFSWDQVAQAFWRRYPNPYSNHVLSEDVIWREVKDNKLYSKRLLTKTNRVPDWGKRFMNSRAVCIVEESIVDPKDKTIITYTRNIGYNKVMCVEEKCTYRLDEECSHWTTVDRQAWITSSVFGFARAIQSFGMDRFRKNSVMAYKGFQHVLDNMFKLGEKQAENNAGGLQVNLKATARKASELAKPLVAAACAQNNQ